jgi:hypothetical protein
MPRLAWSNAGMGTDGATAGYSGTPLPRKLGISPGHRVLVVGAPDGFDLGPLPGVDVHRRAGRAPYDVVLAFVRDRRALQRGLKILRPRLTPAGGLWFAWPKRSSGIATDLDENVLRDVVLPTGLVDNKVCAVDETWSGLRFVVRLRDR